MNEFALDLSVAKYCRMLGLVRGVVVLRGQSNEEKWRRATCIGWYTWGGTAKPQFPIASCIIHSDLNVGQATLCQFRWPRRLTGHWCGQFKLTLPYPSLMVTVWSYLLLGTSPCLLYRCIESQGSLSFQKEGGSSRRWPPYALWCRT